MHLRAVHFPHLRVHHLPGRVHRVPLLDRPSQRTVFRLDALLLLVHRALLLLGLLLVIGVQLVLLSWHFVEDSSRFAGLTWHEGALHEERRLKWLRLHLLVGVGLLVIH